MIKKSLSLFCMLCISFSGISYAQTYNPFLPKGGLDIDTNISNGNNTRTLSSHFTDVINVKDYGAKCDGTTDDSTAFQSAITAATTDFNGASVQFSGQCVIDTALTANVSSEAGIDISGNGGEILVNGNNFISITKTNSSANPVNIHDFKIRNTTTSPNGTMIQIDGSSGTVGSTQNDRIYNIDFYNVWRAVHLIGASNFVISNINAQIFSSNVTFGVVLDGPTISGKTYYSTNGTIDNWYQVGGRFLTINGGLQGLSVTNVHHLDGIDYSVLETTGTNTEGMNFINDYFEANVAGISITDAHSIYVGYSSFDNIGNSPSTSWQAIVLGKNAPSAVMANVIDRNNISGLSSTTKTPIEVHGSLNSITGNIVMGIDLSTTYCISLDTDNGAETSTAYSTVSENKCWHTNGYSITGAGAANVLGTNNTYSDSSNKETNVSFGTPKFSNGMNVSGTAAFTGTLSVYNSAAQGVYFQSNSKTGHVQTVGVNNGSDGGMTFNGNISTTEKVCLDSSCNRYVYEDTTNSKVKIGNATNGDVASIDDSGNMILKGTLTQSTTP